MTESSFTCPRCGATSHNPNDVAQGYCGACHDWTGEVPPVPTPTRVAERLAPGGIYFQVVTDEGEVLAAEGVSQAQAEDGPADLLDTVADRHQTVAFDWCDEHPGRDCWVYSFDGDTGYPMTGLAINTDASAGTTGPVPAGAETIAVGPLRRGSDALANLGADTPLGMNCPICHRESTASVSRAQVFCGYYDCPVLLWNADHTLAEFMAAAITNPPVDLDF